MEVRKVVKYITIGLGSLIGIAILVLTVVNVRQYQQRTTSAHPIDCYLNWCEGRVVKEGKGYVIEFSQPLSRRYPLKEFSYDISSLEGKVIKVKGVVKDNYFYLTSVK